MRTILALALLIGWAASAAAAPYAPKVPVTARTSGMGRMVISAAAVPDAAAVEVPAYPGAMVLQTRPAGWARASDGRVFLPYVKLLSADPLDRVVAWYARRLPGWHYQKAGMMGVFVHRFWKRGGDRGMMDMDALGTVANVSISDGGMHADDYPPARTMIEITYEPR